MPAIKFSCEIVGAWLHSRNKQKQNAARKTNWRPSKGFITYKHVWWLQPSNLANYLRRNRQRKNRTANRFLAHLWHKYVDFVFMNHKIRKRIGEQKKFQRPKFCAVNPFVIFIFRYETNHSEGWFVDWLGVCSLCGAYHGRIRLRILCKHWRCVCAYSVIKHIIVFSVRSTPSKTKMTCVFHIDRNEHTALS